MFWEETAEDFGSTERATQRVPRRPVARVRARAVLGVQPAGAAPGYFGVYVCNYGGGGPLTGVGVATHVARCSAAAGA